MSTTRFVKQNLFFIVIISHANFKHHTHTQKRDLIEHNIVTFGVFERRERDAASTSDPKLDPEFFRLTSSDPADPEETQTSFGRMLAIFRR